MTRNSPGRDGITVFRLGRREERRLPGGEAGSIRQTCSSISRKSAFETGPEDQNGGVRLSQDVFQLIGLERVFHREIRRHPRLAREKPPPLPIQSVGQPDGRVIPGFHPRLQKGPGRNPGPAGKLPVGHAKVIDHQEFRSRRDGGSQPRKPIEMGIHTHIQISFRMKFMFFFIGNILVFCMRNYREPAIGCQEKYGPEKYGSDPAGGR